MASKDQSVFRSGWHEAWGIILVFFAVLLGLSLFSYQPEDIRLFSFPPNHPPANLIGPMGAWVGCLAFTLFGVGGYLLPLFCGVGGLLLIFKGTGRLWPKGLWLLALFVAGLALAELQGELWEARRQQLNTGSPGGLLGELLTQGLLVRLLGRVGAGLLVAAVVVAGLIYLFSIRPGAVFRQVARWAGQGYQWIQQWLDERRDEREKLERQAREVARQRKRLEEAMARNEEAPVPGPAAHIVGRVETDDSELPPPPAARPLPPPRPRKKPESAPAAAPPGAAAGASTYQLPPIHLLMEVPPESERTIKADFEAGVRVLKETLSEFGIEAEVTNVERGPVVTRYELLPAPGVRVEKIVSLSNNIALAMKAETIRVQAPIPGKGVVGIEVPNPKTTTVYLREILESEAWRARRVMLPLGVGKDVGGREIVGDLSEMPHLLIAGATGSGKTVCMNSILAGLLMSRAPDEMRLLLIDPKIVEFSAYNGLPHLVVPVITDPKKVGLGLRWAIEEMEKRYKLFARVGVRNIQSYNARPIARQVELFAADTAAAEEKDSTPARLPYIVIIVDELADLMLVAQAEVEGYIARLAQLSRAVGIHMILATQRPSVNVITGTIKANFPARIAFKVAQKVDSRTILDANGADKLLGKGDMLFLPPGSHKLIRAQGTMTTDQEISAIVEFIKRQGQPQYEEEIHEKMENKNIDLPDMEDDDLYDAAVEIIRQTGRASTSSLQRRLRIGYTRAARLMDLMEQRGLVGPPRGSDPREILIDLDGQIPQNVAEESGVD
jgi:S-DNA-T family DNA segregation ATPase FtsK/SpoIIIE